MSRSALNVVAQAKPSQENIGLGSFEIVKVRTHGYPVSGYVAV